MTTIIRRPQSCFARLVVRTPKAFAICAAMFAAFLTVTGNQPAHAGANTNTILRANPSPSAVGQKVTFTATVMPAIGGVPAAPVEFFDGMTSLGQAALNPINQASTIAIGEAHACAVVPNTDGPGPNTGLKCWGKNNKGQVGNGTTTQQPTPVEVTIGMDKLVNVRAVSAGRLFTCALLFNGAVDCWGDNSKGQIGSNATHSKEPAPVFVSFDIAAIAAGAFHVCGIDTSGGVVCWGDNSSGQLGNAGAGAQSAALVSVGAIQSGAVAIAAGDQHSCALLEDRTVKCWGSNFHGQKGVSAGYHGTTPHYAPTLVPGITNAVALAAGSNHTCAVLSNRKVKCWGNDDNRQLGDGTTGDAFHNRVTPVSVLQLSDAATITAGEEHTCIVRTNQQASCWGNNADGQVGSGNFTSPLDITDVSGLPNAVGIAAGGASTCALTAAAALKCWGSNEFNTLGNNQTADKNKPVKVTGMGNGSVPVPATAKLSTSGLTAGSHNIKASYPGEEGGFQASEGNITHEVN